MNKAYQLQVLQIHYLATVPIKVILLWCVKPTSSAFNNRRLINSPLCISWLAKILSIDIFWNSSWFILVLMQRIWKIPRITRPLSAGLKSSHYEDDCLSKCNDGDSWLTPLSRTKFTDFVQKYSLIRCLEARRGRLLLSLSVICSVISQ